MIARVTYPSSIISLAVLSREKWLYSMLRQAGTKRKWPDKAGDRLSQVTAIAGRFRSFLRPRQLLFRSYEGIRHVMGVFSTKSYAPSDGLLLRLLQKQRRFYDNTIIDVVREAIRKRLACPRERIELVSVTTSRDLYFFAVMPCIVYSTIKKLLGPFT